MLKYQTVSIRLFLTLLVFGATSFSAFAAECISFADLAKGALERAEQLQMARTGVEIAENNRGKALSALMPSVDLFASYTQYDDEDTALGLSEWESGWGGSISQTGTLNGKELKALRVIDTMIERAGTDEKSAKENYLFALEAAYLNFLAADQRLAVTAANEERLRRHRDEVATRLNLRVVTKSALLRAESELSAAITTHQQAETDRELAQLRLLRMSLLEGAVCTELPAAEESAEADLSVLKDQALQNRLDLVALEQERKIASGEVDVVKSDYWPTLKVEAGYRSSNADLYSDSIDRAYVGATINFQIFDGGLRKGYVGEARSREHLAQLNLGDQRRETLYEVDRSWQQLALAKRMLKTVRDRVALAEETYRAVSEQFTNGLVTSLDRMDANTVLAESQLAETEAELNLQLAQLQLRKVTGGYLADVQARIQ